LIKYHYKEIKGRIRYILISLLLSILILIENREEILYNLSPLNLIYTSLTEGLNSYIYIIILLGIILNGPLIYIHYYSFVQGGLYRYEYEELRRKSILNIIFMIILLSITIVYILPKLILFFLQFESENLRLTLKISEYVGFLTKTILITLIIGILPIVINRKTKKIVKRRRITYMVILIISGLVTPPDVVSQIILGLPIILMIEMSILRGELEKRSKKRKENKK
jgi:sec-independent protein translocase protein TatC